MSFYDGPYSLTLRILTTLLIIELAWGIALLVAWWFSSFTVFYAVGLVTTAVSVVGAAYYYFTGERYNEPGEYEL
jgi:hypothetical protein